MAGMEVGTITKVGGSLVLKIPKQFRQTYTEGTRVVWQKREDGSLLIRSEAEVESQIPSGGVT